MWPVRSAPSSSHVKSQFFLLCGGPHSRKNSLFFGHEQAARNFSVLYSLVQTAERHGVNSLAYLEDVLMRVQTHPAARIDELLPDHWKPD